jgi:hypothetical protein
MMTHMDNDDEPDSFSVEPIRIVGEQCAVKSRWLSAVQVARKTGSLHPIMMQMIG